MNNNTLIGGLRIAMQALAGKFDIGLTFSGNTAFTDQKRINLPVLDQVNDRDVAVLARGYIDHEAAHIRFTTPDVPMTMWLNLLEDIRIERKMVMEYPGTGFNLRKLVDHLKKDGESFLGFPENPVSFLYSLALCWGRSHFLNQELEDYAAAMQESVERLFGASFCGAFMELLQKLAGCNSTEDCQKLAIEIEELLRQNQPPQTQPEEQRDQQQDGQGDQDRSKDTLSSSDLDDQDENQVELENQDDQEEGGERNEHDEKSDGQGSRQEKNGEDADLGARFDLGRILQGLLRQAAEENQVPAQQATGYYIEENVNQIANTFYGEMDWSKADIAVRKEYSCWHHQARRCLDSVDVTKRETAQLRAGLAGLLQSVRLQRSRRHSSGHRLARNNCHLIGTGTPDMRVFSSRQPRVGNNTAIGILADTSSSMQNGFRYRVATQVLYVMVKALDVMPGIESIVGHFPAAWTTEDEMVGVRVIKCFGERPKLENFVLTPVGGTPLNAALLWGGMQLGSRPEPRKILLILTDGDIYNKEVTRTVVDRVMRSGVEVYAIGLVEADVSTWLPPGSGVNIDNIDQLPKAMIGMLKKALIAPC